MSGKQKNTPQIDNAAAKGMNFEISIADIAKRSEKRAWTIAWIAIFIVLIMLGGFIYILPLKKEVPYLIMADAFTGQATVATLRGDFSTPNSITQSEALNRSNVAQYIIGRESFDSAMMGLRDWPLINIMSSSNVRAGYAAEHAADRVDSPYKIYGKDRALRVKILSIQIPPPRGQGENARKTATVRFQRVIYNKKNGATEPLDSRIARLEFAYKANLAMDEKDRYLNPLGFQVTEYKVDIDYAESPPVEVPVAPQRPAVGGYPPGTQPYPSQQVPSVPGQPVQGYPAAPDFGEGAVPAGQPQNPAAPTGTQPLQPQLQPQAQPQAPAPAAQAPNQVNGVGNR